MTGNDIGYRRWQRMKIVKTPLVSKTMMIAEARVIERMKRAVKVKACSTKERVRRAMLRQQIYALDLFAKCEGPMTA